MGDNIIVDLDTRCREWSFATANPERIRVQLRARRDTQRLQRRINGLLQACREFRGCPTVVLEGKDRVDRELSD